jgi:hypothetical protein
MDPSQSLDRMNLRTLAFRVSLSLGEPLIDLDTPELGRPAVGHRIVCQESVAQFWLNRNGLREKIFERTK